MRLTKQPFIDRLTPADGGVVFILAGAGGFARGFLELQA